MAGAFIPIMTEVTILINCLFTTQYKNTINNNIFIFYMNHASSSALMDSQIELTEPNSVWRQAQTPTRVNFLSSVKDGSLCIPGPKPEFVSYRQNFRLNPLTHQREAYMKKTSLLPMATYLNGYDSNDNVKYACNPGQYIKYENGHYCCVDVSNKATPQEMLDFVNMSLESFFDNVGFSSAPNAYAREKYDHSVKELNFLLHHHYQHIEKARSQKLLLGFSSSLKK